MKSNQINSWFSAPPTTRTITHYIVQFSSISEANYIMQYCIEQELEQPRSKSMLVQRGCSFTLPSIVV